MTCLRVLVTVCVCVRFFNLSCLENDGSLSGSALLRSLTFVFCFIVGGLLAFTFVWVCFGLACTAQYCVLVWLGLFSCLYCTHFVSFEKNQE